MSYYKSRRMKILHSVADAFAKIRAKDRPVTRINMPQECFTELITHRDSLIGMIEARAEVTPQPLRQNHNRQMGRLNLSEQFLRENIDSTREAFPDTVGKIWGANIYFKKDKLEVLSDDLRYRSGAAWSSIEQMSPPIVETVDLNIKLFYMGSLTIHVKTRAKPFRDMSGSEITAVETLREMISEQEYRKYIKYGFILATNDKGDVYQIFRNDPHTKVWRNGKIIKEVCVRIRDRKIPPTDNLIAFKTMIETDSNEFEKMGNVYKHETEAA